MFNVVVNFGLITGLMYQHGTGYNGLVGCDRSDGVITWRNIPMMMHRNISKSPRPSASECRDRRGGDVAKRVVLIVCRNYRLIG